MAVLGGWQCWLVAADCRGAGLSAAQVAGGCCRGARSALARRLFPLWRVYCLSAFIIAGADNAGGHRAGNRHWSFGSWCRGFVLFVEGVVARHRWHAAGAGLSRIGDNRRHPAAIYRHSGYPDFNLRVRLMFSWVLLP